jgi:Crinkler effector protein N-terminal domain
MLWRDYDPPRASNSEVFDHERHATTLLPLSTSSMADDAPRALLCLIAGESVSFIVKPTGSMDIIDLKDLIKEKRKNGALSGIVAKDLTLWKVRMTDHGQRQQN